MLASLSQQPQLSGRISRNQAQSPHPSVQGVEAEHRELQGKAIPEKHQELDEALASINPRGDPSGATQGELTKGNPSMGTTIAAKSERSHCPHTMHRV